MSQALIAAWPRLRRTLVALTVFLVAVTAVVLSHHSSSQSVAAAERQLRKGFLEPLAGAGLATEVLEACHYSRYAPPGSGPQDPEKGWHFSVSIAVPASADTVARLLGEKTGAEIRLDHDPVIVQQYRGEPNRGWNGSIEDADGGSTVSLVKNNIATSEQTIPIGWQPVCPESRPTG